MRIAVRWSGLAAALFAMLIMSGCTHPSALVPDMLPGDSLGHDNLKEHGDQLCSRLAESSNGRDCSNEFHLRFKECQGRSGAVADGAHLGNLRGYRVLIVHGLLGEVGLKFTHFLDRIDGRQHLIDYLKDQQKALEGDGVEVEELDHKSDSVERGGAEVARRILASDRPVVILSHSKGCLDTLEALLTLQRDGKLFKVAGWVAMQGPFHGAPEADEIVASQVRKIATRVALNCLGARSTAVNDMTSVVREDYLQTHRDEIERLIANIPVISFASWKENPKQPGTDSDGAVPVDSAVLPGSDFVLAQGLSHSATVIGGPREFNRRAFTRALMLMLLNRVGTAKVAEGGELQPVIGSVPGQEHRTIEVKSPSTAKK